MNSKEDVTGRLWLSRGQGEKRGQKGDGGYIPGPCGQGEYFGFSSVQYTPQRIVSRNRCLKKTSLAAL